MRKTVIHFLISSFFFFIDGPAIFLEDFALIIWILSLLEIAFHPSVRHEPFFEIRHLVPKSDNIMLAVSPQIGMLDILRRIFQARIDNLMDDTRIHQFYLFRIQIEDRIQRTPEFWRSIRNE